MLTGEYSKHKAMPNITILKQNHSSKILSSYLPNAL